MKNGKLLAVILGGVGFAVILPGFALAQDCGEVLQEMEENLATAELSPDERDRIATMLESARAFQETGEEEGCLEVVADIRDFAGEMVERSAVGEVEEEEGEEQ